MGKHKLDKNDLNILHKLTFTFKIDAVDEKIELLDVLYKNNVTFAETYLKQELQKKLNTITEHDIQTKSDSTLLEDTSAISHYRDLTYETNEVLSQYMIVATYSFYEKGIKDILGWTQKFTEQELTEFYKIKELKRSLESKLGIVYSSLENYNKIEELRCLNNCIKHNGRVSAELKKVNSLWEKKTIQNTYEDFLRLKDAPYNLLSDLVNQLKL